MLKSLENQVKKLPRDALRLWKGYNDNIKKGILLDAVRAQKLKSLLNKIPPRTMRDAYTSLIKDSRSVRNALRMIHHLCSRLPKDFL